MPDGALSVDEALARILETVAPLPPEEVGITEALGRALAEDVAADLDVPPFTNSAMDGYAVRAADTAGASSARPVQLRVIADVPAGYVAPRPLAPGEAVRIMTGAPLPDGADAVVRVEDTEPGPGNSVLIRVEAQPGRDIRAAGEDVRAGEVMLRRGTLVRPSEVGMLALLGRRRVLVHRCPRVAVLSTGDELVEPGEPVPPGKIRNVNQYSLCAQVAAAGGIPVSLGVARDRESDLEAKLRQAMACDLVVTSAGISVGDYDLVKTVLDRLGRIAFWKVNMRPARPVAFGRLGEAPMFGLPGNPASAMIAFELFARPAILRRRGCTRLRRPEILAVLEGGDIDNRGGRRAFVRGHLRDLAGRPSVSLAGPQGSAMMRSMVAANCLIVIPEEVAIARAGERVRVQLTDFPEVE